MTENNPVSNTDTGILVVSVSSAGGALPVERALVTVRGAEKLDAGVFCAVYTDRDGKTPNIILPTVPAGQSASPGVLHPYATYNIEVNKEGYYPQSYLNVPIFAGNTSIQPVNLIALSEYRGKIDIPFGCENDEDPESCGGTE